jgi:hypothetical protein
MIGNVLGITEELKKTQSELPQQEQKIDVSSAEQDTRGASFSDPLETSNLLPEYEEEDNEEINFD